MPLFWFCLRPQQANSSARTPPTHQLQPSTTLLHILRHDNIRYTRRQRAHPLGRTRRVRRLQVIVHEKPHRIVPTWLKSERQTRAKRHPISRRYDTLRQMQHRIMQIPRQKLTPQQPMTRQRIRKVWPHTCRYRVKRVTLRHIPIRDDLQIGHYRTPTNPNIRAKEHRTLYTSRRPRRCPKFIPSSMSYSLSGMFNPKYSPKNDGRS